MSTIDPTFRIADLAFVVTHGFLRARLTDEDLRWSIKVESQYPCGRLADEEWQPVLHWENIAAFGGKVVQRWTDHLKQRIAWKDCYDPTKGTYNATLCVFSHNDVYECRVAFVERDAMRFEMHLTGKCDLHFDEHYDEGLDLEILAELAFEGIDVGRRDEATARREVMQFIKAGEFEFVSAGSGSGGSMLKPMAKL